MVTYVGQLGTSPWQLEGRTNPEICAAARRMARSPSASQQLSWKPPSQVFLLSVPHASQRSPAGEGRGSVPRGLRVL